MTQHLRLILISALVLTCFESFAQRHFESNVALGVKGGVTLSRVNFNPGIKQLWNIGETVGVSFRYIEEKHFGLLIEANITKGGWKENFEGTNFSYQRDLTYLSFPILTHVFFGNSKIRGFFNLGPQLGYNISEGVKSNFDYQNWQQINDFPSDNRHLDQLNLAVKNKFDYGLAAGAGAEFIIKRKHSFTLEGRLYYGLGNMFPSNKKDTFSASSNMSVSVTLGYSFRVN